MFLARKLVALLSILVQVNCSWAQSSSESISSLVTPLSAPIFQKKVVDPRAIRLMGIFEKSVLDWDNVLLKQVKDVPGKPGYRYFGQDGNLENDIRPVAYGALVNASLTQIEPVSVNIAVSRRDRMRADAVAMLKYLTYSHVTGPGACPNGKKWGDHWQSAMWTRSAALAGWLLWPQLDSELREAVVRMTSHEADRFWDSAPKSSVRNDTGAEENAWNAQILSLAACMMPEHPHARTWSERAKFWAYNALSVSGDSADTTRGDDQKPIRDWVKTINAHSDYTVENHGIVHIGYLKTAISLLLENALPYLLTGQPVPKAYLHHAGDGFSVLLHCMAWDASPVYFSGNDWKLNHTQDADTMMYALLNLLTADQRAAYMEETGLDYLSRIQSSQNGYYNERRDVEYGGVCATRLIAAYFAHAIIGSGAKPVSSAEFNKIVSGVFYLPEAKVLLHRTPTKLASFCWSQKRMALSYPIDGTWVLWPHFDSGLGQINGQDSSYKQAQLTSFHHIVQSNGFIVSGTLLRHKGSVEQSFWFASPSKDMTVYIERLKIKQGFQMRSRETGIIGMEYDLGSNTRVLLGQNGTTIATGLDGQKQGVKELKTDWLNISDRVGYVVRRFPSRQNLMRYHDETAGSGRVPKLQECLSLIGESNATEVTGEDWACLVTFLNQTAAKTARKEKTVAFSVHGNAAKCAVGDDEFHAKFD